MSETLKSWITDRLKEHYWSYRELARQSGVSHSLISKTLSGKVSPSADFCIKIAYAFGESPEALLRLAGILPSSPPAGPDDDSMIQEAVELMRNLSPQDRREVIHFISYLLFRRRREK